MHQTRTSSDPRTILSDPLLNKGTAFTEAERDYLGLHGLLPSHVATMAGQIDRRIAVLRAFSTSFEKYAFLRDLQDTNETLFYALLAQHRSELLPLVYTPTVGEACVRFSEIYSRPRGLFLSYPLKGRLSQILADLPFDDVEVICATDGERILGLGDQGAGGMGIPIGKLSLYTDCAGIDPARTLPVMIDTGTDNEALRENPLYVGWRNKRVRGAEYDSFIEEFVEAVRERWPHAMLQWEDFAGPNAVALLHRYRDRLPSFNDDIQGTAATALAAILSAERLAGIDLAQHKLLLFGAGAAGCGIASLLVDELEKRGLSRDKARGCIYAVDRDGLIIEGANVAIPGQALIARPEAEAGGWLASGSAPGLIETIERVHPAVLIGTSGQFGAFGEPVVRAMTKHHDRPIILPLSNPVTRSEASAEDIEAWSDGRAIIGTGSPSQGATGAVTQVNNVYIFPGIGLGALVSGVTRITDAMFIEAAKALASLKPEGSGDALFPPSEQLADVADCVALAVCRVAERDLGAIPPLDGWEKAIARRRWVPAYRNSLCSPNIERTHNAIS
ncbi:NAD-dependent malic enzyme [Altericroceibacterium endophyticum]|uniref:Oxaloacetate-decarboxylating malate dehydrogenase n=1 Tax=Altericroceibacterium endophyticum TaxID=1808508 RepID=A0A6I4T3T6_9SPHN|nr:NAD-dependent malic enzyme [Altericroceibacterium endophyticum]MXO64811.1 oxaloacetate-decarboxylating malate dehydrogenase [Altericroceibacterium endophyticum]